MKGKKKRIGMMYSGGKDSTYSLAKLLEQGYDVSCLITVISDNKESYMLHTQDIEMTKLTSEALNLPIVLGHTKGMKEEELKDIKQTILLAIENFGIEGIGTGAIASQYQKTRIDSIGSDCGLSVLSPLWGIDQRTYMRTLVFELYRFILTSVSCEGLNESWLGRELTIADIDELQHLSSKYGFNIAFEGGEAETLVLDCPLYSQKRLRILDSRIKWNGYFGSLDIKRAVLENKPAS
jgi:diphthine-ammonia ligase